MASQIGEGDFILSHGEEYQQCPYSLAHVITNARLIVHLDKCRRNYIKLMKESGEKVDMRQCKFNYTHHVPSPEIDYHESRCPDQYNVVDHIRYHESDEFKSTLEVERKRKVRESEELSDRHRRGDSGRDHHRSSHKKKHSRKDKDVKPVVEENPWGSDAEDWESEAKGYKCGYDPAKKLENDIVLYHPRGMSKSERKTFRHEQKQKASQIPYPDPEEFYDVKPFSKLDEDESYMPGGFSSAPPKTPLPKPVVKPEPVQWTEDEEKEDGECSGDDEFFGEDPFA